MSLERSRKTQSVSEGAEREMGPPTRLCRGGESGGLGCFDDDRVVSRCNPSTERDFFCKKTCIYQKKAVSLQVELIFMRARQNQTKHQLYVVI